jgi:hypothetical protein
MEKMSLKFAGTKIEAGAKSGKTSGLMETIFKMADETTRNNFSVKKTKDGWIFVANEVDNLGEMKRKIFQLPGNPHGLIDPKTGHTNAKVHSVARNMAVKRHLYNGVNQYLMAKKAHKGGSYEVVYLLESSYVACHKEAEKLGKEAVELIEAKWGEFRKLEDAYPKA